MSKTSEGLKTAFAGESQANRKYMAFAKKAEEDGHPQVARLFRAAAAAETVHALNHFRAAGEVKSTTENIQAAIQGEHYEWATMYPPFIEAAESEGEKKALNSFRWAWEVEKEHELLFQQALDCLGKEDEAYDYYICPVCGHTHPRSAPEKCPVCGVPGSRFERVN